MFDIIGFFFMCFCCWDAFKIQTFSRLEFLGWIKWHEWIGFLNPNNTTYLFWCLWTEQLSACAAFKWIHSDDIYRMFLSSQDHLFHLNSLYIVPPSPPPFLSPFVLLLFINFLSTQSNTFATTSATSPPLSCPPLLFSFWLRGAVQPQCSWLIFVIDTL